MQLEVNTSVKSDFWGWGLLCVAPVPRQRVLAPAHHVFDVLLKRRPGVLGRRGGGPHNTNT